MSVSALDIRTWLWPDHVAGKRETRRLREEHNNLAIEHHNLRIALANCIEWDAAMGGWASTCWAEARKTMEDTRGPA